MVKQSIKSLWPYLTFDPGFNALIEGHYIKVLDAPTVEGEAIANTEKVYEADEIKSILEKRDITAFAKLITNATPAEREAIKKYAVELRVTDAAFATLIKKYCGVDIVESISNYNQTIGAEG